MFFLRCAFWLSIVYASMTWAPGTLGPANVASSQTASSLMAAGRSQAETLVKSAAAGAADLCARHPAECIADAARLTSLVATTEHVDEADPREPEATAMTTAGIPLPVPDPRRRARDAKLARAP